MFSYLKVTELTPKTIENCSKKARRPGYNLESLKEDGNKRFHKVYHIHWATVEIIKSISSVLKLKQYIFKGNSFPIKFWFKHSYFQPLFLIISSLRRKGKKVSDSIWLSPRPSCTLMNLVGFFNTWRRSYSVVPVTIYFISVLFPCILLTLYHLTSPVPGAYYISQFFDYN